MRNRATVLHTPLAALVLPMLLAVTPALGADGSAGKGSRLTEMPMHVQTEGTSYNEYRQHQAELQTRLAGSLPAAALGAPVRIELTRQEIDGIEKTPHVSGTPLTIGLVKAVAPRVDLDGLETGAGGATPRRGPGAIASPARDGGFVWALAVTSASAGAIRLHIENMSLPSNAELYFYSRSGEAFGPYRKGGPNGDGDFWTDTLFGIEGILQLHLPASATPADLRGVALSVTEAGIVAPRFAGSFTPTPEAAICGDPACVEDASCTSNTQANAAKLAVAKMEWAQGAFIYSCTGGLISDTNPAQGNFFLTANHCLSKNNTARNVQFYWRFATSSCNGSCPSNTNWPYKTMGATVAAAGKKSDFTLLQLNANPPSGSVFLGWTATAVANTNGAQLYRVSNPDFGPQVYSEHSVDTSAPTCGGWPRGGWIYSRDTFGAIDGGSSGSPIINASAQIVGQLSGTCGSNPSDPCSSGPGEANATVDGAFAAYFPVVQPIINP